MSALVILFGEEEMFKVKFDLNSKWFVICKKIWKFQRFFYKIVAMGGNQVFPRAGLAGSHSHLPHAVQQWPVLLS
jgi:hypothetical protein